MRGARGRRAWSVWTVVAVVVLVLLGIGAFAAVAYLPSALSSSEGTQTVIGVSVRVLGFGFLLGAGYLVARQRRPD